MELFGMILTKCSPEQVVQLLSDPEALQRIVPKGCTIGSKTDETIAFVLRRKVGPINLTLHGELMVRQNTDGLTYAMELRAKHVIAGWIKVLLDLDPHTAMTGKNRLNWTGTLESHGLAARLVEEAARRRSGTKGPGATCSSSCANRPKRLADWSGASG